MCKNIARASANLPFARSSDQPTTAFRMSSSEQLTANVVMLTLVLRHGGLTVSKGHRAGVVCC